MEGSPCQAVTKEGKQCSRNAKVDIFCTQHSKVKSEAKTLVGAASSIPKELPQPSPEIGTRYLHIIEQRFKKYQKVEHPLVEGGGEGYIYIYYLESEKGQNIWKIGQTKREVDERLNEWKKKTDSTILLHKSYKLTRQGATDFVERTIHDYFKHWNIHRYPQEDGTFVDKYFMSKKNLKKEEEEEKRDYGNKTKKHVEWFVGDINKIKFVLQKLVDWVNN